MSRLCTRRVPREVEDDELLIRAVTNWHLDGKKLLPNLFINADDDEVSVSRHSWVEKSIAKIYAKVRIQDRFLERPKYYKGLAFVTAKAVRDQTSKVLDSRSEYLGHADIVHGFKSPSPGEAMDPKIKKALKDRAKLIAKATRYIADTKPKSILWRAGEP